METTTKKTPEQMMWWSRTGEQVVESERVANVAYYRPATLEERLGRYDVVMEVLGSGGAVSVTDELPDAVRAVWDANA